MTLHVLQIWMALGLWLIDVPCKHSSQVNITDEHAHFAMSCSLIAGLLEHAQA